MDMRRGLDFDDTVSPDDVLPLGYDNDPRPSYREQLKLSQEKLYKLEAQRDTLLAAVKAAPMPIHHVDYLTDLWFVDENEYVRWYNGPRQAAIAAVEGE